ncbi:MAG: InlB B-repeat-containing protein [Candidatus Symbiothrix sp.]|jgi:uncharacterized protein (TIGR02145 family)/uncharacterized repeat protein (TIGR02543 family)|nr:InlB B-repeat-containing protein [Candidatus Symbiothrix sp.]
MKKIKYYFVLLGILCAISAFADNIASGTIRNVANDGDINWVIDENYVLTVSGIGAIPDYSAASKSPWGSYRTSIEKVIIEDGITHLGKLSFGNVISCDSIIMANSVKVLGQSCFTCNDNENQQLCYIKLSENLETIETNALRFLYLREIIIPASVTSMHEDSFFGAESLTSVHVQWETPPVISSKLFQKFGIFSFGLLDDTLRVPDNKVSDYQEATLWSDQFTEILAESYVPSAPATYFVAFDTRGGSPVDTLFDVESGALIAAPESPLKESYTFEGWYVDSLYTAEWDFATSTVVSDTTLYALWAEIPEPIDAGRGNVRDIDGNWYTTQLFGSLEWMTENLRVIHWNDGTEIPYGSKYTAAPGASEDFVSYYKYPNNDSSYVADYGLLYTWNVAFDHEGNPPATVIPRDLCPEGWRVPTRTEWASLGDSAYSGDLLTVTNIPSEFNPQFAGDFSTYGFGNFGTQTLYWTPELMMPGAGYGCKWLYINASDPTTIGQSNNRNNNAKSFRCVREPKAGFRVAFDSDGGSEVDSVFRVESGSLLAPPKTPAKDGYTLAGWFADAEHTAEWDFETSTVVSDTTLYALWKAVYTVAFDARGGSAVDTLFSVESGATITAPESPLKDGFTFEGWYVDSLYTAEWDFAASTVVSDTTLYAKWEANNPPEGIYLPTAAVISIFPNPAGQYIKIIGIKGEKTLTITDFTGKTLLTDKVSDGENIAVGKLAAGVYLVKVDGEVLKLIKQ